MTERPWWFAATALLIVAWVMGFAGRDLDRPGVYYDEAIQAVPAAEFLRDEGRLVDIPGATHTRLFGGWFPLMTQPYMSALKSHLLIPVFAAAGADPETLRTTTLAWGCVGLLLCMLWMRAVWGTATALLAGVLLAVDPSFLFVARHDWGSVSLALVLRGGGAWLLATGWPGKPTRLLLGGLLLGLGVTNKIDALAFLGGAGLALIVAAPGWIAAALREHRRALGLAAGGALLGALPILLTVPTVLRAARGMATSAAGRGGDFGEKLDTWAWLFDGSYFHRLMQAGGRFDAMGTVPEAATGAFGVVLLLAMAFLLVRAGRERETRAHDLFLALATVFTIAALLLVPRAARIHHVMNVLPLPQVLVASAAVGLWRRGGLARGAAGVALAAALVGQVGVGVQTLRDIDESGGRGRWSNALARFAAELPDDARVVSIDWGFHAPLLLLRPELELDEPAWQLLDAYGSQLRGTSKHVYLVHADGYGVLAPGQAFAKSLRALESEHVSIETVEDESGAPVFHAVRIAAPHALRYDVGWSVRYR